MTTKIDGRKLSDYSSWDIARYFNCEFSGDMNCIDHGGFFYDSRDWKKFGYASIVEFWRDCDNNDEIVVRCATVNNNQSSQDGKQYIPNSDYGELSQETIESVEFQIEDTHSHWGSETLQDFSGDYVESFPDETPENTIWRKINGWMKSLSE